MYVIASDLIISCPDFEGLNYAQIGHFGQQSVYHALVRPARLERYMYIPLKSIPQKVD